MTNRQFPVCTSISLAIGKSVSKQQQKWLAACEIRIAATKSMLNSIKAIKMMGAGDKVGRTIEDLRTAEFTASKPFRISLTVTVIICKYIENSQGCLDGNR